MSLLFKKNQKFDLKKRKECKLLDDSKKLANVVKNK